MAKGLILGNILSGLGSGVAQASNTYAQHLARQKELQTAREAKIAEYQAAAEARKAERLEIRNEKLADDKLAVETRMPGALSIAGADQKRKTANDFMKPNGATSIDAAESVPDTEAFNKYNKEQDDKRAQASLIATDPRLADEVMKARKERENAQLERDILDGKIDGKKIAEARRAARGLDPSLERDRLDALEAYRSATLAQRQERDASDAKRKSGPSKEDQRMELQDRKAQLMAVADEVKSIQGALNRAREEKNKALPHQKAGWESSVVDLEKQLVEAKARQNTLNAPVQNSAPKFAGFTAVKVK